MVVITVSSENMASSPDLAELDSAENGESVSVIYTSDLLLQD